MVSTRLIIALCLLIVVAGLTLDAFLSRPGAAAASYQSLLNDPGFTRAVKSIAEQCRVNVDIARLQCS